METNKDITQTIPVSVFSGRVIIPLFFALATTILLPATIWYIFTSGDIIDIIGGLIAFVHLLVMWMILVFGELRLRALQLSFTNTQIEVKPFFGLGKIQIYSYESISGFTTMLQPALPLPNECLILSNETKEVVRISQFYFSNYMALKKLVIERYKNQGIKRFSLKKAFTEIYKKQ